MPPALLDYCLLHCHERNTELREGKESENLNSWEFSHGLWNIFAFEINNVYE